jgi:hypothetical protein
MNRILILFVIAACSFSSCKKDCLQTVTYTTYEPVYISKEELRSAVKTMPAQALKKPGKIYLFGKYLFVNEIDKGIHIIDNSNPSSPQKVSFINIPGNLDMAVIGDVLYADSYVDLVTLNIANPLAAIEVNRIENAIPDRSFAGYYYDPSKGVVTEWKEVQKTDSLNADCSGSNGGWWGGGGPFLEDNFGGPVANTAGGVKTTTIASGKGGSMARFAISGSRLYIVDNSNLKAFSISNPAQPIQASTANIGWDIETIFPYQDKLFIGSQTGMRIYSLSNPDVPAMLGSYMHMTACDPVVVEGSHAFVTLRSGSPCTNANNQLDVIDISNAAAPKLLTTYPFTNPHGLGIDNGTLFICDGSDGLKVFDATDVMKITANSLSHFKNIQSTDVIPHNKRLWMTGADGLYQYNYGDINNITLLSKIGKE